MSLSDVVEMRGHFSIACTSCGGSLPVVPKELFGKDSSYLKDCPNCSESVNGAEVIQADYPRAYSFLRALVNLRSYYQKNYDPLNLKELETELKTDLERLIHI